MKSLVCLIILFILTSCSTDKDTFWCGDHPCISKKEKEAYFKKTMIVEIRELNKATDKNKSEVAKIMKQAKVEEKKRIKNEKYLAKQARLEEKMRIKEEKKLAKQVALDEKKIIKKEKKATEQNVSISSSSKNVTIYSNKFKELAERIIKKNAIRPYPDINVTPN